MALEPLAFVHMNSFRARGKCIPREVAMVSLINFKLTLFMINLSDYIGEQSDREARSNSYVQMYKTKLRWESPLGSSSGEYHLSDLPALLADRWRSLSTFVLPGNNGYFICKGSSQKTFFQDQCKLPVLNIEDLELGEKVPTVREMCSLFGYRDFCPWLSDIHTGIHINDDVKYCSAVIAHIYAQFLLDILTGCPSLVWAIEEDLEYLAPGRKSSAVVLDLSYLAEEGEYRPLPSFKFAAKDDEDSRWARQRQNLIPSSSFGDESLIQYRVPKLTLEDIGNTYIPPPVEQPSSASWQLEPQQMEHRQQVTEHQQQVMEPQVTEHQQGPVPPFKLEIAGYRITIEKFKD